MTNKEKMIKMLEEDPEKFFEEDWQDKMCRVMEKKINTNCPLDEAGYPQCNGCFKAYLELEVEEQ